MNIVLFEPEIPQNTGNIGRTCVVTNSSLHMIKPFKFKIDDNSIKRAGMDYWSKLDLYTYNNYEEFLKENEGKGNFYFLTTKTTHNYCDVKFTENDYLIFGPESRGLPEELLRDHKKNLRIPMGKDERSLNLSNSVAICLYEGLRQLNFLDLE